MDKQETFGEYLYQLGSFYDSISGLVNISASLKNNELRDLLDEFYSNGWDFEFGDGFSFYSKVGNYITVLDLAKELGKEEELSEILEKIWQILPQFYEIHQKLGDPIPQIPEKWF